MELSEVLRSLRDRFLLVLAFAVLAPLVLFGLSRTDRTPQASSIIEVHRSQEVGDPDRFVQNQLILLRSDAIADAVAALVPGSDRAEIQRSTRINQRLKTDVIDIVATSKDSERAVLIAHTYAQVFIERNDALNDETSGIDDATPIRTRMKALTDEIAKVQVRIDAKFDTAGDESEKAILLHEYDTLASLEATRIYGSSTSVVQLLQDGAPLPVESHPPAKNLAAALVGGGLLGSFLVLALRSSKQEPLRTIADAEAVLGRPALVTLPYVRGTKGTAPLLGRSNAIDFTSEVQKACALLNSEPTGTSLLIGVASSERGSGCSTIARNIAAAFAVSSHRTILVDADLVDAACTTTFNADNKPGIGSLLGTPERRSTRDLRKMLIPVGADKFKFELLPAATHEAPVGAFDGALLATIVEKLQREAEFVIFDLGCLSDNTCGALLAEHMTKLALVIGMPCTDGEALRRALDSAPLDVATDRLLPILNAPSWRS